MDPSLWLFRDSEPFDNGLKAWIYFSISSPLCSLEPTPVKLSTIPLHHQWFHTAKSNSQSPSYLFATLKQLIHPFSMKNFLCIAFRILNSLRFPPTSPSQSASLVFTSSTQLRKVRGAPEFRVLLYLYCLWVTSSLYWRYLHISLHLQPGSLPSTPGSYNVLPLNISTACLKDTTNLSCSKLTPGLSSKNWKHPGCSSADDLNKQTVIAPYSWNTQQ